VKACGRLAGFHNGFDDVDAKLDKMLTTENPDNITSSKHNPIMTSLCALLTAYLAKNINGEPGEILKLMNSNTQNPNLIWDNSTRTELRAYLENERDYLYKKGVCQDEFLGQRFTFSVFEKELIIGDIYARIYNEMPSYNLVDPKKFCIDLLDFLGTLFKKYVILKIFKKIVIIRIFLKIFNLRFFKKYVILKIFKKIVIIRIF